MMTASAGAPRPFAGGAMQDDRADFKPLDPGRIHVSDPVELAWWCTQLHCSQEQLTAAVAEVGDHVTVVREALQRATRPG